MLEVLVIPDDIRLLIMNKAAPMVIRDTARKTQGLKTLRHDALTKALNGYTTLEEVNRVTFVEDI